MEIQFFKGREIQSYSKDIIALRSTFFREYPYLYDVDLESEKNYLKMYFQSENSILVIAKDKDKVVGAVTGVPLNEVFEDYRSLFLEKQIPVDVIYYLGEIVLLKEHKDGGIERRMYDAFEKLVREKRLYRKIALYEISRTKDDPRKPKEYAPIDTFWEKLEFIQYPELQANIRWKEVGDTKEKQHPMHIWIKELQ